MKNVLCFHIYHPVTNLTLFAKKSNKQEPGLVAVKFGIHEKYNDSKATASRAPLFKKYAALLNGFLDGIVKNMNEIEIDLQGYTPFQKKVLITARRIPWGTTVSYKELAVMSGHPDAARAVAAVMRNNRFPLIIPCHRVVRHDGTIGGFTGQKEGVMVKLKRTLLEYEGVFLRG